MPRAAAIRKADLDRVIKALKDAGQEVARIEVRTDGVTIVPLTKDAPSQRDDLADWRARKNGRHAVEGA